MRGFYIFTRPALSLADILDLFYMHPGGVHIYILTDSQNCLVGLLIGIENMAGYEKWFDWEAG